MTPISNEQFLSLRQHAELIEADHYGEKVLKLSDGSFLKLFRRKRLISSEIYRPYAARFALNAKSLEALQVPCPVIIDTYTIESIERTAVHYWPLPGATLRQAFQGAGESHAALSTALGAFIARLHHCGVYFRSLHLGNIVKTPESSLGLIDIADMKVLRNPIGAQKRKRNFRHLFRYSADVAKLDTHSDQFIGAYCENLTPREKNEFSDFLSNLFMESQKQNVKQEPMQ